MRALIKTPIVVIAVVSVAVLFVATTVALDAKPNRTTQPTAGEPPGDPILKGPRPQLWRLRRSLPAPTMEFDPDAPVVDVEAEANGGGGPAAGDLDPTIDVQITQEIIDKALELGSVPAIYEFVRDQVAFQAYYGSQKGSVETLRQLSGNDYDQASLLIALLRGFGVPARYGEGVVEMPVDRATNWLVVEDGEVASSILFTNGMEGTAILGLPGGTDCCVDNGTPGCDDPDIEACVCAVDAFCCNTAWDQTCADEAVSLGCSECADNVVAVRARRIWVEAWTRRGFGGDTWVPLDPVFHRNEIQLGIDIPQEMGLDAQTFIDDYWDPPGGGVTLPRPETPVELLEMEIQTYLDANYPGMLVDDVRRTGGALAPPLPPGAPAGPCRPRERDLEFRKASE